MGKNFLETQVYATFLIVFVVPIVEILSLCTFGMLLFENTKKNSTISKIQKPMHHHIAI